MMRFLLLPLLAAACATAQGDDHGPKKAANQDPKPVNRLAKETSPYLRQHMHNPVDWYPWGEEALALAKKLDKPIFLSIGYAACHWCHVMEHESFENPAIAKLMNENFVCIKVDREERPDLDEIYMASVQAMTGRGGWPMSVWMTPDLKPFYGGTYFPPKDGARQAGFPRVLTELAKAWKEKRQQVEASAGEMTDYIGRVLSPTGKPGDPEAVFATKAAQSSVERYDGEHGGFGQAPHFAPKFPHAAELSMLLRESARTGDSKALAMVEQTLIGMAHGGMYDQLAGGFHRYSVDRVWLVPHFEKMLYDNAQLARTYAEAYAFTGNEEFARIAKETLDYLVREMQHPKGGFYSTTDADSEGVEGKYFVWSKAEVDALCGADAEIARLRWGVTEAGNWEHTNVLHVAMSVADVAKQTKKSEAEVTAALERSRTRLLAARSGRVAPGLDDKVLTAWNGLAIAAMAVGYQTFGDERYLESARRAAEFVLTTMRVEGRLRRTWRDVDGAADEARLDGYLEDYSFFVDGLLCLSDSDPDPRWLREARGLLGEIEQRFGSEDGNFYFTADDHESLIARTKSIQESSVPSGIAMATMSFLRAGLAFGDPKLTERGVAALRANHYYLSQFGQVCPSLVMAMQFHLGDPVEIVVAGDPAGDDTNALRRAAFGMFPPHRVVLNLHDGNREALEGLTPVVKGKVPVDGKAAAYVCRMGACEAPVTDPAALENR